MTGFYYALMVALALGAYFLVRGRAAALANGQTLHSRPSYHGLLAAAQVILPMILIHFAGSVLAARFVEHQALVAMDPALLTDELRRGAAFREIREFAIGRGAANATQALQAGAAMYAYLSALTNWAVLGLGLAVGIAMALFSLRSISGEFRARNRFEQVVRYLLMACATVAVITTIGIVFSVLFETFRFFQKVSPIDFLFGTHWSPQTAIRADQVGSSGSFGMVPLLVGTLLISTIAILVAGPIGLFAAIYMAEYASPKFRAWAKPILEILAGIPTVVLGFFAALTVAPLIREVGTSLGLSVASESALAAGLVMGIMIVPFVSSLSDDVITAVPQSLRDGSFGMGATRSETIKKVVLPAALPGIVSAFMLAISRAVGETMIVVMAAGLAANLSFNPLDAVTTFTVQIKTILVGDQEFDSAKTLAAFALGFVLFFFTLTLNVIALAIVRKYREQYD
ncbi:MAG: phosphate ABC transporter permease subunit PstC [Beijerinckiaceae bacterium]|nr:phosphate ABC transporter permease subunit PstC [Beijerinckiaceae bacterium]MCZ8299169.1 phosphate ABC transporter permease subunit PstC [Beijerinckiaceae bacterium]